MVGSVAVGLMKNVRHGRHRQHMQGCLKTPQHITLLLLAGSWICSIIHGYTCIMYEYDQINRPVYRQLRFPFGGHGG